MINSGASHTYLHGPCEGISIHRIGRHVWVYDEQSDERYDADFPDERTARLKVIAIRRDLYKVAKKPGSHRA